MMSPRLKVCGCTSRFFGRRNVGKSSLLNALTRQQVSIVSPVAGTTTDPGGEADGAAAARARSCSLTPRGSTTTARWANCACERRAQVLDRADLGVIVAEAAAGATSKSNCCAELAGARRCPLVVVFNKADAGRPDSALFQALAKSNCRVVQTRRAHAAPASPIARRRLLEAAPAEFIEQSCHPRRPGRSGRNGRAGGAD